MASYDVIVVGAGAAGAAVAARLSEDSGRTVLLLEAGKDYKSIKDFPKELQNASTLEAMIPGNPADWGFKGQLHKDLQVVVNRGKVLGGSTALNGTYFVRARKSDFDGWSQKGNDVWKFENVLPYFKKLETDEDFGETDVHGGSGPMLVHRPDITGTFAQATIAGAKELGFPEETDKNDQQAPGIGALPMNAPNGVRWNTGEAYINPVREERKNLTVQGETFVRRVVFEGTRAVGVEVEHKGEISIIKGGEIVLSAGAMKTPHILMLSGVGPKDELGKFGIPVVKDLAGVGKGFSDHPDVLVSWQPKLDLANYEQREQMVTSLNFNSDNDQGFVNDLEFIMSDKPLSYLMSGKRQKYTGALGAALKNPIGTLKAMFGTSLSRYIKQMVHATDNTLNVLLQKQASRGDMTLQSADPNVYPRFDYNYFSAEVDRVRMRQAIRTGVDLLNSSAFDPIFKKLTELDQKTLADDKALDAWIRSHLITGIHMAGTAKFAVGDDPSAVTDQYGKVLGVEGLRIADTSILPDTTSRGPAATAVMIGELMADLIKADSGDKPKKAPAKTTKTAAATTAAKKPATRKAKES